MPKQRTIGVLAGGESPEREISLVSGKHVFESLILGGGDARLLKLDTLDDLVPQLKGIDVVFNCLHGGAGEDGTVQLLLDVFDIPYAGSGVQACARAMDKAKARRLFASQQIPIARGLSYQEGDLDAFLGTAAEEIGFPLVIKPGNGGSTIGVSLIESPDELRPAAVAILEGFPSVVVEEYVGGRELTTGILRIDGVDIALPVVEIVIPGKLFDYEAKYTKDVAEFLFPAPLDEATGRRVQDVSLRAHNALGCYGYSRVDLRLADDDTPYVLEVNTLPGMTPMSDLPRSASAIGIDYDRLVQLMLATTLKEDE
ncbi:D-alanine--D-alanine ligase [Candidatus Bipolaricaulota bacterium]|nr:D-alanine--D-alanine ligase [Candidatus Bipolaricaulota bacterium]